MVTPTSEQQAVIEAVAQGKDMVIQALAGTGKTTTLQMIANYYPDKKFLYIVFNKSQQKEAEKKMPSNVESRTGDSLAWMYVKRVYEQYGRELHERLSNQTGEYLSSHKSIGDYFKIQRYKVVHEDKNGQKEEKVLSITQTISILKKAIDAFCVSNDPEISINHFKTKYSLPATATSDARRMWEDIKSLRGKLKVTHTHIAKLWSLKSPDMTISDRDPSKSFDAIMIDEAQDTNPVFGAIYSSQRVQKIYVGDQNQAIYGFRGAEDELQKVKVDIKLPLTESWRFGPNIAQIANRFLSKLDAKYLVKGLGTEKGQILPEGTMREADVVLCRTNAGALRAIFERIGEGQPVKVDRQFRESLSQLLLSLSWFYGLLREKPFIHPDLEIYDSREELEAAIDEGQETAKVTELAELLKVHGLESLQNSLNSLDARNRKNCVEVITAHRSKGSEWDRVQIYTDFWGYKRDYTNQEEVVWIAPEPEEFRLAYVATTRAKKELDPGSLSYILPENMAKFTNAA